MRKNISILFLFSLFLFLSCNKKEEDYNNIFMANIAGEEVSFEGELTAARYLDIKNGVPIAYEYEIINTKSPKLYISVVDSTMSDINFEYPNINVIYAEMGNDNFVSYFYPDYSNEGYFNIYKIENNIIYADFYFELLKRNSSEKLIIKSGKIEMKLQYFNRNRKTVN